MSLSWLEIHPITPTMLYGNWQAQILIISVYNPNCPKQETVFANGVPISIWSNEETHMFFHQIEHPVYWFESVLQHWLIVITKALEYRMV